MNYGFTYAGTVENNKDPLKLGRLKVRVPHVYGSSATGSGYIATNDLPWALPAGMPAGGSSASGGFSQLPTTGDKVWVRFLDGEPEKPIWEWGMQSVDDAKSLKLHRYAIGVPVGAPDRAFWTRYSHAIEINEGSIIATTSQGYRLVLLDASSSAEMDGSVTLTTKAGNMIVLDDLDNTIKVTVLEDLYFTVLNDVFGSSNNFTWNTMTGNFDITTGGGFSVTTVDNIDLLSATDANIDALGSISMTTVDNFTLGFALLKLGLEATEAAVLGDQLFAYLESVIIWADTHTHTSSLPGTPTSPPNAPAPPVLPTILSETVTVQN